MKELNQYELGRIPPQAIEVEDAVLGALMLKPDAIHRINGIIDTASFYKNENQIIFETIKDLHQRQKQIDLILVTQELKDKDKLDSVGGAANITRLVSNVSWSVNIEPHARIIAEKFYKREMIKNAFEILSKVYEDEDVEVLGSLWRKSGDNMEDIFTIADSGTHIRDVLKKTLSEIEIDYKYVQQNRTPGISTGFRILDDTTGGWRNGNMIVLAARPNVGKTSFALFFALEAAKAGYWVNIFSLEMKKEDLARIILAGESGIYRSNVRDGYLQDTDWEKLNDAITQLEKLPIIFRDAAGMTIDQVKAAIRKNRRNKRCDFVFVDYLQLVQSSKKKGIRELEVSEISRAIKTLALTENIPIMALSQLNRLADGEVPKLSNLRESGAIEQDADIVCFLHKNSENKDVIQFIIAKHRRGKTGETGIYYNNQMTKFSESPLVEENNGVPY